MGNSSLAREEHESSGLVPEVRFKENSNKEILAAIKMLSDKMDNTFKVINDKLDSLLEVKAITKQNCYDIARLRSI